MDRGGAMVLYYIAVDNPSLKLPRYQPAVQLAVSCWHSLNGGSSAIRHATSKFVDVKDHVDFTIVGPGWTPKSRVVPAFSDCMLIAKPKNTYKDPPMLKSFFSPVSIKRSRHGASCRVCALPSTNDSTRSTTCTFHRRFEFTLTHSILSNHCSPPRLRPTVRPVSVRRPQPFRPSMPWPKPLEASTSSYF